MAPRLRLATVVVFSSVLLGLSAWAQQEHPNVSTGSKSENLFVASAEDDVNVFSGNLSYRVPLGIPVPAGPNLKLSAALVYNSNIWTNWLIERTGGQGPYSITLPHPAGDRILGTGWQLHFGRLVPGGTKDIFQNRPAQARKPRAGDGMLDMFWIFVEPDGTTHEFYDRLVEGGAPPVGHCSDIAFRQSIPGAHCFWYSHDSSFIRLDPYDPIHGLRPTVYLPDGTVYEMGHSGGRYPIDGGTFPDDDMDYAYNRDTTADASTRVNPPFDTTRIVDPFGNAIAVQYYGDAGAPAHPLDPYPTVLANHKDSIVYRSYVEARPPTGSCAAGTAAGGPAIEFKAEAIQVDTPGTPTHTARTYFIPRITKIYTPIFTAGAPTTYQCASYDLTFDFNRYEADAENQLMPVQELTTVTLPNGQQYLMSYDQSSVAYMGGPTGRLTSVTLPATGKIDYTYLGSTACPYSGADFFSQQPELCSTINPPVGGCIDYGREPATTICSRTTTRAVNGAPQKATTAYVRSYAAEPCNANNTQNCQLRVDVWEPASTTDPSQFVRVSRSQFSEVSEFTKASKYGRPMFTSEYFVAQGTPSSAVIDGSVPFRVTTFDYEADVADDIGAAEGFNHNTREVKRTVSMDVRTLTTTHGDWDGYGHLGLTQIVESDGVTPRTLREVRECHLTSVSTATCPSSASAADTWILSPITSRATSRPATASDPPGANLSATERFTIDPATGFVQTRVVNPSSDEADPEDHRVLTTRWTMETGPTGPCLPGAAGAPECAAAGFPTSESTQLTGYRLFNGVQEQSGTQHFVRSFFYRYGSLSAAQDSGMSFLGVDRDIAITGQLVGERPPSGRTSPTDPAPALTTTYEYDLLGRVTKRTLPGEWPEMTTYTSQAALTRKCPDASCASIDSASKTFFDGLGRPIVRLRIMPGASSWSYRVSTLDEAGRAISASEWQAVACALPDPCSPGDTTDLSSRQATIDANHVASPPGTVSWNFDVLGRAQNRQLADGSSLTDSYVGWWEQFSSRGVNQKTPPNVSYHYGRDGLGRLISVAEPTTPQSCASVLDTATYTYDAFDRLISASKTGNTATCDAPFTQARTWAYDDFGWLVSEKTPEVPNHEVRKRDGRGNIVVECMGPTASCDEASNSDPLVWPAQDRIEHSYDGAGRLQSSRRFSDPTIADRSKTTFHFANSFEDFYYDTQPISDVTLNLGPSNGRLVYSVRHNLAYTNHWQTNFGWFTTEDLYHYLGPGGRLSFRQMNTFMIGGTPSPGAKKPVANNWLLWYYTSVRRRLSKDGEGLRTAATGPNAPQLLDPYNPTGWFRWQYGWDANTGRLASLTYPRRDEGFPTTVGYVYDHGWLSSASAQVSDPFAGTEYVSASFTYNPSGTQQEASILANPHTYSVQSIDDGPMPRIGSLSFYGTNGLALSYGYTYDGSGNVLSGASQYSYDTRSRLVFERSDYDETRTFDSFGNLLTIQNPIQGILTLTPELATNRHTATGSGVSGAYDANRGTFVFDAVRQVGRDYYQDQRILTEYHRTSTAYDRAEPGDLSIYLLDGKGERTLTFNGDETGCQTELFRHTVRDESGRILTDYKADTNGVCECGDPRCQRFDRFERDYIWLGSYTLLARARGEGTHVALLDHLGTPTVEWDIRTCCEALGRAVLGAWGDEKNVSLRERTRFTGHERAHVNGDGTRLPISDYMHARTYVPVLGRFVSPDVKRSFSLLNPTEMNRYLYANGNPSTYVDLFGFTTEENREPVPCDPDIPCQVRSEDIQVSAENPTEEEYEPLKNPAYVDVENPTREAAAREILGRTYRLSSTPVKALGIGTAVVTAPAMALTFAPAGALTTVGTTTPELISVGDFLISADYLQRLWLTGRAAPILKATLLMEAATPYADAAAQRPGQIFWIYTARASGQLWTLVLHPLTNEILHFGAGVWRAFPGTK